MVTRGTGVTDLPVAARGRRTLAATTRRALLALSLPLVGAHLALGPGAAAVAAPPTGLAPAAGQAPESQEEARQRELEAQGALEDSTAAVRQAAESLRRVAAELPAAQRSVSVARGELAGARAKAAAATAAVRRAEAALTAAQAEVETASARVLEGRDAVAALARRSYQRGRLGDLQDVMEAGEPQDVIERTQMLRSVFKHGNASLERLTRDRLALASTEAALEAEERDLERARAEAESGEQRAAAITAQAEAAARRVAALVAQREQAVGAAEANRSDDERAYRDAQAASAALAERIRAAQAKAAAERAAAERAAAARAAAERAAAERAAAARPGTRAAPPPRRVVPRPPRATRSGRMQWPANGRLTSRYGFRTHPIFGDRRLHAGIDIGAPTGTPIVAAEAGTVILSYFSPSYGNLTVVDHGEINGRSVTTAYAHQSVVSVSEGQRVARGQLIGRVGNTGNSTGAHLHFEVRLEGDPVDPLGWVSPP
jgi:murein DD-endopeptidase MepM/ murein hydrolase activator NlpD